VTAGYPGDCLERLQHNEHGRPSIDSNIDFNLSHSGEYVVCLLMKGGRGGIDIERIRPIQVSDFRSYMTAEEWSAMTFPEISYPKFYDYWTSKESVMKADGRGLYLPLSDIVIQGDQARVDEKVWFLKQVEIDQDYACHIATTWETHNVRLKEIKFGDK
jgi:4'-phosphopantetheinyl transferase